MLNFATAYRYNQYRKWMDVFDKDEGGLLQFSKGHDKFGFNVGPEGITYREWVPNGVEAFLTGDFNEWNRSSHPMTKNTFGVFEIFLPTNSDGSLAIPHDSKVKVRSTEHAMSPRPSLLNLMFVLLSRSALSRHRASVSIAFRPGSIVPLRICQNRLRMKVSSGTLQPHTYSSTQYPPPPLI